MQSWLIGFTNFDGPAHLMAAIINLVVVIRTTGKSAGEPDKNEPKQDA